MKVALYTYSTKPRGGVVHTLALAEALQDAGNEVVIYSLSQNGSSFFRPVKTAVKLIPFSSRSDEQFESRILRYIDTYVEALEKEPLDTFDIHHAQDCISANSLYRLREKGLIPFFCRTVHHLDDFTTPALVQCQNRSVIGPDALITVSRYWQDRLESIYERSSQVIYNGVEQRFFQEAGNRSLVRDKYELEGKTVFLTIGGIEPRKNTLRILRAYARVKEAVPESVFLIVGGDTLFDYQYYRKSFFEEFSRLPSDVQEGVRITGSVDNQTLFHLYHVADCFVQPSIKEGWGLAILEAMAAGVPVIASDIPVFKEYLVDSYNALLANPEDDQAIARQMIRAVREKDLADTLILNGKATASKYTWQMAASEHMKLYRRMINRGHAALLSS
ncbi:glycosyl transferase, group 1, putative [Bacillus methanolicus MGA3]|uniref:Glycosyl transferase group 1 n=1 Tax=Bacillus methanolicus (strain MGA3 / ATCC 53907) TaxID=796606 RepID=I3EB64_BACMM|nr:glycosyl transferase group 1 [Bacillus methanolicus MGA3]EIJ83735.1 glycosyl transferase, group 1, putative [Bacillus methanolicus MGA3]